MVRKLICLLLLAAALLLGFLLGQRTAPDRSAALPAAALPASTAPEDGRPQLIAHAGGAIYGYRLTNSLEALDAAYAAGHRYIELDFELTSDGEVVLIHDWESMAARMLGSSGQRSLRAFRSAPAFAGLTLLSLDDLLLWLSAHTEVSIITDIKSEGNAAVLEKIAQRSGALQDGFIPQIYAYDQYEPVRDLGYERIILSLYRMQKEPEVLAAFAAEHPLWAVTIDQTAVSEELIVAVDTENTGAAIYCHTVNDLSFFEQWHPRGVTGIYTDYFIPDKWPAL
jgi:glycerophosphoryl diester phosphodiesterase